MMPSSRMRRRHVTYVTVGLMSLINFNFPFNPSFPTIGEGCDDSLNASSMRHC